VELIAELLVLCLYLEIRNHYGRECHYTLDLSLTLDAIDLISGLLSRIIVSSSGIRVLSHALYFVCVQC